MGSQNVGSTRRAGRSARRLVRQQARAAVRRNWKRLVLGLVVWVAAAVGLVSWQQAVGSAWSSGFLAGVMVGLVPLLWQVFLAAQGLAPRSMGAEAEAWTGSELRKLTKGRWHVVHDVFLGDVNVDHVAVGSERLYAVETKWVGQPPSDWHLKRLAGVARARAAVLERALADVGVPREVTPLLILWGRVGSEVVPAGGRHLQPMRVTAVAGHDASTWLARMEQASPGRDLDWPVVRALEEMQQEQFLDDSLSPSEL